MYKLAPTIVMAEAEHGAVLLDERTGRYWMMNDTAFMALRCVLDGGSIQQAAALLCENYGKTDVERAEGDTRTLLDRLQTAGLVVA